MRASNILSTVTVIAASAISADGSENGVRPNRPCFNDICWTSWKCHYERASSWDDELDNRCGLPANVYRQGYDNAPWTTLVWGEMYRMSWTSSYESQDEEIVLEWLMFEAPGTEKPIQANETDMFIDYRGEGPERFVVAYSQNISRAIVYSSFGPSLSFFPNAHLNISSIEATGYALERNVFRLYHPKTFNPHNSTTWDLSEPFMVIRPSEENMIKKAASNQKKADNKQLAIGVGVGVGVACFVASLVSWYMSAWYQKRVLEKKGFVLSPARLD